MTDAILRTENLEKSFGKLEVLKGITTEIKKGEVVSIIGPSGGGKSTFLRCLNLLEKPDGGKIFYKGQDVTSAKLNTAKYRQSIGMVFQHFNVFPNMTVLDNVTLEIPRGKVVTIIGQNGCGKSSLLKTVSKAVTPSSGSPTPVMRKPSEAVQRWLPAIWPM